MCAALLIGLNGLIVSQSGVAQSFAERMRHGVEGLFALNELSLPCNVTVSLGITQLGSDETHYESAFRRAGVALYNAKTNGRNRVEVATGDPLQ